MNGDGPSQFVLLLFMGIAYVPVKYAGRHLQVVRNQYMRFRITKISLMSGMHSPSLTFDQVRSS